MELPILPTSIIGSYPKPWWLTKYYDLYKKRKISENEFQEAVRDASTAIVREHETAGVDVPWDGEMGREEMVEYFAAKIRGFIFRGSVRVWGNFYFNKASIVGPLEYRGPLVIKEFKLVEHVTAREIVKVPITGPYTIAEWSFNEYYDSKEEVARELAKILNKELKILEAEGAKFVQIDEPALTTHPDEIEWAVDAVNEAIKGLNLNIGLHVCYSDYNLLAKYFDDLNVTQFALEFANRKFREIDFLKRLGDKELGFGVIDVHNPRIETSDEVARNIRKVFEYVRPEKVYINPDCGMKLLSRETAREKLCNMVKGTKIVRKELERRGKVSIQFEAKI